MTISQSDTRPIALLDSGVGGLSILREVRRLLPHENLLYFADRANVPYGPRELTEIRALSEEIVRFLLGHDAKIIVVACNAASAASLHHVRATFPDVPFVGMEPAIKPAAENTQSGVIGVITTEATFQGELFASVVGRFAQGLNVETQVCPDFVKLVEEGYLEGETVLATVRGRLEPLLAAGIDQLVLGCTHFPFLEDALAKEAGAGVTIVDPGPAVARQVSRIVADSQNGQASPGRVTHFTSSDTANYVEVATRLLNKTPGDVRHAKWQGGSLLDSV